jgi:hypothetical protein
VRRSTFAYSFSLLRHGGPMAIDLHWRVAEAAHPAFPRRLNEPWDRLIDRRLGDTRFDAFGPEDTLLHISAHAAKHRWGKLRWICDIAELLGAEPNLDWDDLLRCASQSGPVGERTLLVSLGLAGRLFQAPLPLEISKRMGGDRCVQALLDETVARLERTEDDWPLTWPRSFESDAQFLAMIDGPLQKAHYFSRFCVWRVAVPDAKDRAALSLPTQLSFLYYLLRPFRMLREYGVKPLIGFARLLPRVIART